MPLNLSLYTRTTHRCTNPQKWSVFSPPGFCWSQPLHRTPFPSSFPWEILIQPSLNDPPKAWIKAPSVGSHCTPSLAPLGICPTVLSVWWGSTGHCLAEGSPWHAQAGTLCTPAPLPYITRCVPTAPPCGSQVPGALQGRALRVLSELERPVRPANPWEALCGWSGTADICRSTGSVWQQ